MGSFPGMALGDEGVEDSTTSPVYAYKNLQPKPQLQEIISNYGRDVESGLDSIENDEAQGARIAGRSR
jgi:hypothetical protein